MKGERGDIRRGAGSRRGFIILILLVAACATSVFAADVDTLRKAIEKSGDDTERALLYKDLGDLYVSGEDYSSAADAYQKALSLSGYAFTPGEKTTMAVYLSWAGRLKEAENVLNLVLSENPAYTEARVQLARVLSWSGRNDEAIKELNLVLSENPAHAGARVQLARVLSWSGRNDEAIKEADRVLKDHPGRRDPLLIKANAMRWKGENTKATPIYEQLLQEEENFDARLGLTYTYLSNGYVKKARESFHLLKPKTGRQEKEFKKLSLEMIRETRPNLEPKFSFYKDTDGSKLYRYALSYNSRSDRWKTSIHLRHTDARDATRNNRAEDLWAKSYGKVSDSLSAGGGLGFTQLGDGNTSHFGTGHIRGDYNIWKGKIGASLSRDVFSETAQLIENRIRFTDAGIYLFQNLSERLSIILRYNYRDFSDENSANSLQLGPKYDLYRGKWRLSAGVRLRYVDYKRQSGSGYFDPNNFKSSQFFLSFFTDADRYYLYLEPYFGSQSFERYGEKTDKTFGGATGSVGFKLTERLQVELNGEGGDYALASSSGFRYYLIGFSVNFYF